MGDAQKEKQKDTLIPIEMNNEKDPPAGTMSDKDVKQLEEYARMKSWSRRAAAAELIKAALKRETEGR